MMYMLKINMLVAAIVFGAAGLVILALFVWTEAKEYANALAAMQRIPADRSREHSRFRD